MLETERLKNLKKSVKTSGQIFDIRAFDFSNCESTCDLSDVPSSIYDRKIAARSFGNTHDILRCLSLVQSFLKDSNASICRKREPTHMRLSGTDGLN